MFEKHGQAGAGHEPVATMGGHSQTTDGRPRADGLSAGGNKPDDTDLTSTTNTDEDATERPGLPRLNYNLWDHKIKLGIVTALLVAECSLIPVTFFYGLYFFTSLRHGIVFAIITSFFGIITGLEFALRCWRLVMLDGYRPIGAGKWQFDFTHWTLSCIYTIMTGILIGASIPHEPLIRPLALPVPLFFIQLGLQLLVSGVMHAKGSKLPCRFSSQPKGDKARPLVYTIVEDIVAVDGGAGVSYRTRLNARYLASPRFRGMLSQLNWFWTGGSLFIGIGCMIVLWTVPQEVAYGVAWGAPLVFTCIWTPVTVVWARRGLRMEKALWVAPGGC